MSMEKASGRPNNPKWLLDVKAFAAAALVLDIGVAELEAFVEALAGVIELGALQVGQALRVDQDLDAVALELQVLGIGGVGELELVGHARAAGGAHAEAPTAALIASSARIEQWIFTGGSDSSCAMCVFLICVAWSSVLPLTHSVTRELEAIAE